MPRFPQKSVNTKGSLRSIQHFVNEAPSDLDGAIARASNGRCSAPIAWKSPRADDEFAEYRDQSFLDLLGIQASDPTLRDFWPLRGPQWDALGLSGTGEPILVEAKAHIGELITPASGAGQRSLRRIREALKETAAHLGAQPTCDWSGTFYQYANRLAHLYLLHERNKIDSWLVFVYFMGDPDMDGPTTQQEWEAAIRVLRGALGLKQHPLLTRVVDVFLTAASNEE